MIPAKLNQLASELGLEREGRFRLRLEFGLACLSRVEHLLTETEIVEALTIGKQYLSGRRDSQELADAASKAIAASRSHAGSNSLDGSGNAAVSTSYAVAAALAGRALAASEYAAYASVYAYSSSAVTDPDAYRDEQDWQIRKLQELVTSNHE